MTEELKKAIDEAIDTLPRDVLSHVSADRECYPAFFSAPASECDREADAKVLWKWIREHFRRVLVALAKDQNAQSRFAKALPKPWVYDNLKWPDLSNLSPEAKAECERVDKENDAILASLHPYERKCCAIGLCQPPPEAQKAIDEAEEKYQKERQQWSGEFWAAPFVWVWALWHVWPKVTGQPAIPGCPEWPGVKRLSKDKQSAFRGCFNLEIGPKINCYPGPAANMLNDALGQLPERLAGESTSAAHAGQASDARQGGALAPRNLREWANSDSGTFAVVFTDIVGSVKLRRRMGDSGMKTILKRHFGKAESLAKKYHGFMFKTTGDGVIALFRRAPDALKFTLALEASARGHFLLRAGIHVGDVGIDSNDCSGGTVDLTKRVMDKAKKGGVYISDRAMRDIKQIGEGPRNVGYEQMPGIRLKGFDDAKTLWQARRKPFHGKQ